MSDIAVGGGGSFVIPMTLETIAVAVGAVRESGSAGTLIRRVTTDSRDTQPGDVFFALIGERFDGHGFIAAANCKGAAACVCTRRWFESSGAKRDHVNVPFLVVDDTETSLGELAAYYRAKVMSAETTVVAITGSNGKTTTKCLLDHVLGGSRSGRAAPGNFNNQIGVPLTLLSAEYEDRYLIVEIGTNAPGEVTALTAMASPDVGVITSIGEAHLAGLGNIEGVAWEKASLLPHVRASGLALVNIDRGEIRRHLDRATCSALVTMGTHADADRVISNVSTDLHASRFRLDDRFDVTLPIPGLHHAANAAAAFVVAQHLGISPEEIVQRLASYAAGDGRARVFDLAGLTVVDDAYNANPVSMAAAIETHSAGAKGRRVFVMGDMLELGAECDPWHRRVVRTACDAGIDILLVVGPILARVIRSIQEEGQRATRIIRCDDATAAVAELETLLQDGDAVWVKGSRATRLDRVVAALKSQEQLCVRCAEVTSVHPRGLKSAAR